MITLEDLKRQVDYVYDNANRYGQQNADKIRVGINVRRIPAIGGTPIVDIKCLNLGMDFDRGKIIIFPDVDLREIGRDEIASLIEKYEELSWKQNKITGLRNENEKVKREITALQEKIEKLQAKNGVLQEKIEKLQEKIVNKE